MVAYLAQFEQILYAFSNNLNGERIFESILHRNAFVFVPSCLDVDGQKLQVTVTGRRPTSWKSGKTVRLSSSCPEKKGSRFLARAHPNSPLGRAVLSVSLVMSIQEITTGVVKP